MVCTTSRRQPADAQARPVRRLVTDGSAVIRVPRDASTPAPRLVLRRKPPTTTIFRSKRYKVLKHIARGGRGIVYKAVDKLLGTMVAVKLLPRRMLLDRSSIESFKKEARIVMQLSQENIVKLHNLETENGRMFLVMEYVEGRNFREILNESPCLSIRTVLRIAKCCALALSYAHETGVLHKDLKPENLMLTDDAVLKIVDFGTAFRMNEAGSESDERYLEGTPAYMSPEQVRGRPLDPRTDVYSLALVLYECLAGHPAYALNLDPADMLRLPSPPLDDVPPAIAAVIAKALARNREERWPTVGDFYYALAQAAEPYAGSRPGLTTSDPSTVHKETDA